MKTIITNEWNHYLDYFTKNDKDIYFTEEYVKLYENDIDKALCIVCRSDDKVTIMPFLRRKIYGFYDFETPYGYGGPITNLHSSDWIEKSLNDMKNCFIDNNYLCGFIRFHPILNNAVCCNNYMDVLFDRKTISIDLDCSIDEIWSSQINSKNRNMIRKAEKNGLAFRAEYDYSSIDDFKKIYNKTMNRLEADEFYYFNNKYYDMYVKGLLNHGFLGIVSLNNKVIAAALFMIDGEYGHYHLAGSDKEFSSYGSNNFMIWNAIKEMKMNGIKKLHLGGGTTGSSEDTLYKFKKSFNKADNEFYIGKIIFKEEEYLSICKKWGNKYPNLVNKYGGRLLKYRYKGE